MTCLWYREFWGRQLSQFECKCDCGYLCKYILFVFCRQVDQTTRDPMAVLCRPTNAIIHCKTLSNYPRVYCTYICNHWPSFLVTFISWLRPWSSTIIRSGSRSWSRAVSSWILSIRILFTFIIFTAYIISISKNIGCIDFFCCFATLIFTIR